MPSRYLPGDDRRHFVAWSEASKEDFAQYYFAGIYAWWVEAVRHLPPILSVEVAPWSR